MRPRSAARRHLTRRARTAALAVAVAVVAAAGASCGDGSNRGAATTSAASSTSIAEGPPVTAATASPPTRVRPPEGGALATVDRDAGVSARLGDDSILWLFGDTAARRDDGTIEYFVPGTAAWSPADAPTSTDLAVDPATGGPVPFVDPATALPDAAAACAGDGQRPGVWPSAAVVRPDDVVVVWLHVVCLGPGDRLGDLGMALAEWRYDPASPPGAGPIVGTVVQPHLFAERSFGTAAVLGDDGRVYAYRCDAPADAGRVADYGPCAVAAVALDRVADPSAYEVLDDAMDLPGGQGAPIPPGGFGVVRDPVAGRYLMAYSPWPGSVPLVALRTAPAPTGPWSAPTLLGLPGCDDRLGQRILACYAAGPQPWASTDGRVGIGWYDSAISTFPIRGSLMVATVPATALP